jgi:hypothetical protein
VGDRETNFGQIEIGSDPGYALVERVTNAIDAVIEREALRHATKKAGPMSPREASEVWLKVPGGRVAMLRKAGKPDIERRQELADSVVIRLLDGASRRKPTVEVRDLGIGLTAHMMPLTILSLGGSNKIDKPYLAGAFGQGGSTTFAFSKAGTLLVSRRQTDLLDGAPDNVSVTFVRYNELDPAKNKNGRYEYLVSETQEVGSFPAVLVPSFDAGTQATHFDMDIQKYAQRMTQLTGSLWWLLQNALFDPVIPIWAEEARPSELKDKKQERRVIVGNYTRLTDGKRPRGAEESAGEELAKKPSDTKRTRGDQEAFDEGTKKSAKGKHARASNEDGGDEPAKRPKVEYGDALQVDLEDGAGQVTVNYWVLADKEDSPNETPIASYVDPYHPVAYTLFGQLHGTDDRRLVAERLQLPNLAKSLVVQVELDNLKPSARREILSTTRDRLKLVPFFELLRERVCGAMMEDEDLARLDQARKERLLAHHTDKDREKIRQRFAKLMEKHLRTGADATATGGGEKPGGRPPAPSGPRQPLPPLETKEEPTFIRIGNTQKPLRVRLDRSALLRIESDAPDGYLASRVHARLHLASEPEGLVHMDSRSDFRGGRARMTVKPGATAKAGDKGALRVFLLTPKGETFTSQVNYLIEAAEEKPTAGDEDKAKVQVPDPVPVTKEHWPDYGWTEKDVAEVRDDGKTTEIYVNMDNVHIHRLLHSGGYQAAGITRMKNNYLLYAGFYAYIQFAANRQKDLSLDGEAFERYRAAELDRMAQTVVHAISAAGRLDQDDD